MLSLFQLRCEVQRAVDPHPGGGRVQLQAEAGLQARAGPQHHAGWRSVTSALRHCEQTASDERSLRAQWSQRREKSSYDRYQITYDFISNFWTDTLCSVHKFWSFWLTNFLHLLTKAYQIQQLPVIIPSENWFTSDLVILAIPTFFQSMYFPSNLAKNRLVEPSAAPPNKLNLVSELTNFWWTNLSKLFSNDALILTHYWS